VINLKTIFNRIEHIGWSFRINPREIAKGITIYDRKNMYVGKYHNTSTGNPFEEHKNNKEYFKIKKDKDGRQYLHIIGVDSGGYDACTFKLYFDNDEDLLNFLRRE